MSIYRVPAPWGNTFGLGITGRKAVPRVPHCILMAIAEDSPKGQKHSVKYFWISKAWFGLSRNVTETAVMHSNLEKGTLLLPNFNRGKECSSFRWSLYQCCQAFTPSSKSSTAWSKQNSGTCGCFPGLLDSQEDMLSSIQAEHKQA